MSLSLLFQSVLSGLTNGFVYGLVGLGLASIFRGTRIINAMQGDFALIGGITAVLRLFFAKTALGLSMMAAALDAEGALVTGINVPLMRTLTFVLGGLVGGLAGVLVGPLVTVYFDMGLLLTLKGFAAAILGGLAN